MRANPWQLADKSESHVPERRGAGRVPAAGPVFFSLFGTRLSITGQLRDVSEGGFRAVHTGLVLRSGDQIEFQAGSQQGTATVVWTRASGLERESGFRILETTTQAGAPLH